MLLTIYINCPNASRALCTNGTRQSALSKMGKRQRPFLPCSPFTTPRTNATIFSSLANRGDGNRLASDRRTDVPEKVGEPALYVNAEGQRMERDGEVFGDGHRGGRPAIPRRPESRVRSMRRPGWTQTRQAQRGPGGPGDPERLGDGPARWGGPHPRVAAYECDPTA